LSPARELEGKVTVEMARGKEEDGLGSVLRIWLVDENGAKIEIREVPWVFHDLDEDGEMSVGMYVAKPTKDDEKELLVDFEDFEIQYRD
jgi:hypothetical protein